MEKLILKRSSLSDEIINYIQAQILEGKINPGQMLPSEKEMCELFSVGRSTVREAIKALLLVGLLEKKKDGTYVKNSFDFAFRSPVDYKLILKQISGRDLLEARRILEVQLVGLTAERATPDDLQAIHNIMVRMEQKITEKNFSDYVIDDVDFHLTIAGAAHNAVLSQQIIAIRELLIDFQKDLLDLPIIPQCHQYHCHIYEAIRERDAKKAQKNMLAHLEEIEHIIIDMNKEKP